ncbi:hypothetical protein L7F22_064121 [Adiantum nelumboides]|nr:hypothetical protein [Adiantum nelumboides]
MIGHTLARLYAFILEQQLSTSAEREGMRTKRQAGFRRRFSTLDHLLTLRAIIEKGRSHGKRILEDLVTVLEAVRIVAVALSPVTPQLSLRIYLQLGYSVEDFRSLSWEDTNWGSLTEGQVIPEARPVFKKIEIVQTSVDMSASNPPQKKRKQAKEAVQSAVS